MDTKLALNAEITRQASLDRISISTGNNSEAMHVHTFAAHSQQQQRRQEPPTVHAVASVPSKKSSQQTEWNAGANGTFQEHWPSHLPRPPSMRKIKEHETDSAVDPSLPKVIVFNANTHEGSSIVRVFSGQGLRVVAVVRVITSRNAKNLTKLKNVVVKVTDLNNEEAVIRAAEGCQQAFLVTKYWERFENAIEEQIAKVVLTASMKVGIQRLVLATFEDTAELRRRGLKSQLMPTVDGKIFPSFETMDGYNAMAKKLGVQMTHMMTSYLDEGDSKKSLVLIRGVNGKIKVQENIQN